MQNTWSIDITNKAWKRATLLHAGQKYGGAVAGEDVDYINHVGSVVFEVLNALPHETGANADLAILCAMLHDTVEDTEFTYENVLEEFGKSVADGVLALTKNENLEGKQAQMQDSLKRIKTQPKEVWMVKLADRIVNLSSAPYYWNNVKKMAYKAEGQVILDELKDGSAFLAERLAQKIAAYQNFIHHKK